MAEQKGLIENIMDFFRNRDEIYVLGKILDGKYDFSKLSNKFKDNKEFMLQAINNQDIGHRLKIDREGKAEVEDSIIKYASQNLRNDKDIVLKAIEKILTPWNLLVKNFKIMIWLLEEQFLIITLQLYNLLLIDLKITLI